MRLSLFCFALLASSFSFGDEAETIAAMNERIDKLEITSDEIVVRAQSMNELELVVATMEKKQAERLANVKKREAAAKKRIIQLDSEFDRIESKVKGMEAESQKRKTLNEKRLDQLRIEVGNTIEANIGESKTILVEKLITKVKQLMEENDKLRRALSKQE